MSTDQVPNYDNVVIWTFGDDTPEGNRNLKWQLLYGVPEGFGISCCNKEDIWISKIVSATAGDADKKYSVMSPRFNTSKKIYPTVPITRMISLSAFVSPAKGARFLHGISSRTSLMHSSGWFLTLTARGLRLTGATGTLPRRTSPLKILCTDTLTCSTHSTSP